METTDRTERSGPEEIVLTYRPQADEVRLRYERPLPRRMEREPEPEDVLRRLTDLETRAERTPAGGRRRRGVWAAAVALLLVGVVCIGLGIWFILRSGEGARWRDYDGPPRDYYWEDQAGDPGETTIHTYRPVGGGAALELSSADGLEPLTPGEVYSRVRPATVTVLGYQKDRGSVGTGIIFDAEGYVLTNYHVIAGSSECEVRLTDQYGADTPYDAWLVGGDEDQDLAVLKIDGTDLPTAEFGQSSQLAVGDPVYAIGNPLGVELRATFTNGIVSAIDRDVDVDGVTMTLIQTNAALNSGNSGGPLVNQYGQVVGINTIKMMSDYDTIEGLGFSIPTSWAAKWVNEIIRYGEILPQPVLGITIHRVPETLPDGTTGLRVTEVTSGGSGDRAGVLAGDRIVAFDGQAVGRMEELLVIRHQHSVGDLVPLRVWRNGEYLDLTMKLQAG